MDRWQATCVIEAQERLPHQPSTRHTKTQASQRVGAMLSLSGDTQLMILAVVGAASGTRHPTRMSRTTPARAGSHRSAPAKWRLAPLDSAARRCR